jgi:hypothetical protein
MKKTIQHCRFALGRHCVHLGLRIMPPGRVRSELLQLMDTWCTKVNRTIKEAHRDHVE